MLEGMREAMLARIEAQAEETPQEAEAEQKRHVALSAKGLRYAALALGTLGDQETLLDALEFKRLRQQYKYTYPPPVRRAALEGLAWLPAGKDAVPVLRELAHRLPDAEMKRRCEAAILTALGLQARAERP